MSSRHSILLIICILLIILSSSFSKSEVLGSCDLYVGCGNYSYVFCGYSTVPAAKSACELDNFCNKPCISEYSRMSGLYYVYTGSSWDGCYYEYLVCQDSFGTDTDGDGIPDSTDPCPNNPNPDCRNPDGDPNKDTDGDGIPDDEDPCPNNPNPNCTDPNDPPGPTIPGEIVIGDCEVDISSLKAWLLSDDSFPFNFIWRVYTVISPLLDLSPEPPVLEFDFSLDPSSKYSWVPDTVPLKFDFTQFNFLAKLLRYFEIAGLCLAFAFYGMKRYRNFTGAGG